MNDQEKYALFTKVKETSGPCEICGWKDGDGTRTCFYGKKLGIVRHENSEKGIMSTMDESQKHLYKLRQELVYISDELREKQIAHVVYEHHQYEVKQRNLYPHQPPTGSCPLRGLTACFFGPNFLALVNDSSSESYRVGSDMVGCQMRR